MKDIIYQSRFDRVLYNQKNEGAYFTDLENAKLIAKLFKFPKEEVCCLEPSIGDGSAVSVVSGKDKGNNVTIFGVEVNKDRYLVCKQNPHIDYVINSDFLQGTKISNRKFSFCFANPPYGISMAKERIERSFLRKLDSYMMGGAVLCYIVPYYIFRDDSKFSSILTNRYDVLTILKFREPEFSKFKQIAIIGRKKDKNSFDPDMAKKVEEYVLDIDNVIEIPLEPPHHLIEIMPSDSSKVTVFEGSGVDIEDIKALPNKSNIFDIFFDKTLIKDNISRLSRPPIPPGKDHLYLLSVSGYSEGIMGSEENKDMHLQRGNVITSTKRTSETLANGKVIEKIKQYKKTKVIILENNGKFTELKA